MKRVIAKKVLESNYISRFDITIVNNGHIPKILSLLIKSMCDYKLVKLRLKFHPSVYTARPIQPKSVQQL